MLKTMLTATDSTHRCNRMPWQSTVIHRGMLLKRHFFGLQNAVVAKFCKGRFVYIHAWRNITTDPIENNHLAVYDETSLVSPERLPRFGLVHAKGQVDAVWSERPQCGEASLVLLPEDADG